jgi:hypothetical protein
MGRPRYFVVSVKVGGQPSSKDPDVSWTKMPLATVSPRNQGLEAPSIEVLGENVTQVASDGALFTFGGG